MKAPVQIDQRANQVKPTQRVHIGGRFSLRYEALLVEMDLFSLVKSGSPRFSFLKQRQRKQTKTSMVMPTACNIKNLNDPKLIFPLSIRSPPIWMTLEKKNARYKRASLKKITPTLEIRVGKKYSMQLCVEDTKVFHHEK